MSADAAGVPSSPIELMILGALQYLGRLWLDFDNVEEGTAASEEVHRIFFPYGSFLQHHRKRKKNTCMRSAWLA
jgi:hypothetical protein